jgi:hypothetical protein
MEICHKTVGMNTDMSVSQNDNKDPIEVVHLQWEGKDAE